MMVFLQSFFILSNSSKFVASKNDNAILNIVEFELFNNILVASLAAIWHSLGMIEIPSLRVNVMNYAFKEQTNAEEEKTTHQMKH